MSMLLKTVNPEAAEAIEAGPAKVGVGNMVVYHARAGYMRAGRTSFPAIVFDQQKNGDLNLLVILEREDIATEEYVPFQSHNQSHHCWSFVEPVAWRPVENMAFFDREPSPDNVITDAALLQRVNTLEERALDMAVLAERIHALEAQQPLDGAASGPSALDISILTKRIAALEKTKKPAAGK